MKFLRILGIALGVLLALLVLAAGALYALFDGETIKAEAIRTVQEKTGRTLAIEGDLALSLWPEVGIRAGRVSLSEPGGKGEFLALDSARVAVAVMPLLSRQVQVEAVTVDGLRATLVKRKDGSLNIADLLAAGAGGTGGDGKVSPGGTAAAPTPLRIDIAAIALGKARLTWRDEQAGRSTTLSDLDFATGRLRADTGQQTLSTGQVRLGARLDDGAGKATVQLLLEGVEATAQRLAVGKLALDLDAEAGTAKLRGRLESPLAMDLAARSLALEKLAGQMEIVHPALPMKPLTLPLSGALRADLAKSSAELRLDTRLDESAIALKLGVPAFSPLALNVDLGIDRLDVDKYLPPATAAKPDAPEGRLDFSALKGLNLAGRLRIGELRAKGLTFSQLDATLRAAGGRLDVAPLSLNLYEGSARGSLSLNAHGNVVGLRQNLSGVSIAPLLKDLADKDLMAGKGSVSLDVSTGGETVTAMKQALAGSASLSLKDGALKGINLAQSFRDLKAKLSLKGGSQETTETAKAGAQTDFSELTASFRIAGGVARNDDLAMKSPFLRLAGAGDIDIGRGRMDYLARASVVASTSGQGGEDLAHLKGLTVPVRISGPFDALSYKIEFGSLVSDAAKAKVEEKKEEVKQKVEDKVKDKLKGLFKK